MRQETALLDNITVLQHAEKSDMPSFSVLELPHGRDLLLLQSLFEVGKLKAELDAMRDRCIELEAEVAEIGAERDCLRNRVNELEAVIQILHERVNLGSDTSGIPSSMDRRKNCAPEVPEETGGSNTGEADNENRETPSSVKKYLDNKGGGKKRQGGQEGHAPTFMSFDADREGGPVAHYPGKCRGCPNMGRCIEEGRLRKVSTSHEYDIEITRVHTEHHLFEATECLDDGAQINCERPDVIGGRFYGKAIQLLVLVWHHLFHGSYDRIALAAKELLGLSLGKGTAVAIVRRAGGMILGSGFMDALRFYVLLFEEVVGVDETGARTAGRNAWVHTIATANITLLSAHWRRGFEGTVYAGVLQFFTNTLLSDCWASYFNDVFKKCRHAICDAHILRELVAAAYFRHQRWAIDMFDLLLEIFSDKKEALENGLNSFSQKYIDDVKTRYRQIVKEGFDEIAGQTKGKTHSLLTRLDKLEDAALAFAADFNVDFTNNVSEQSLRDVKVALRVIGQFKTMPGLVDYCIIQSFMDTCRKQGHNPFDMMRLLLSGGDIIGAVFGPQKAGLIKRMICLADAFANGGENEVNDAMAAISVDMTDELLAAASYGRFKAFDDPPPAKDSSSDVHKDKMKAAREKLKNTSKPNSDGAVDAASKVPAMPMARAGP